MSFGNDVLLKAYNDTEFSWLPLTHFYVSLHTANPKGGDQTIFETNYTNYRRVAVERTDAGWIVSEGQVANVNQIRFPTCTGGNSIATHFAVGILAIGAGQIINSGELGISLSISENILPFFRPNDIVIAEI